MLKAFAVCVHHQVANPPDWPQATNAAKQTYNQALAVSGPRCELDAASRQSWRGQHALANCKSGHGDCLHDMPMVEQLKPW